MLAPLIEAKIPFAATFGNHDNQANISHIEELNHIKAIAPLAYVEACASCGGAGGEANYFIPVYPCEQGGISGVLHVRERSNCLFDFCSWMQSKYTISVTLAL